MPTYDDTQQVMSSSEFDDTDDAALVLGIAQRKSLSVIVAAVFIVGAMCGSGILALPKALVDCGWSGLPLLIICGLISSYTGTVLGKCWTIVRQRYPEYSNQYISDPYPTIGFRAAGKWGRRATRFAIIATLFGGATVFLLLVAGNLENLLESLSGGHKKFHTCIWLVVVVAALTPLTWLGTPKDFWQAGIIAATTTSIGGIIIVISLAATPPSHDSPIKYPNPTFTGFFNSFGTILFAFGGASCFPNIQVDMEKPDKFPLSVVIGIMTVLTLYIPVSMSGFIVIGDQMQSSNILDELANNWMLYTVIILITSHLLMAVLIVANPVNQDLEGFFEFPDKFTWKRCLLRTCVMLSMLFVGLTIPHFGVILSLVGGTTVTASNFVLPPLFYLLLSRQETPHDGHGDLPKNLSETVYTSVKPKDPDSSQQDESSRHDSSSLHGQFSDVSLASPNDYSWTTVNVPLHEKVILIEIIFIGIVGGIASTYSVLVSLIDGSSGFTVPCYVDWGTADPNLNTTMA